MARATNETDFAHFHDFDFMDGLAPGPSVIRSSKGFERLRWQSNTGVVYFAASVEGRRQR